MLANLARTLAALAVIPVGIAVGVATFVRRRNRQAALNQTIEFWGRWGPRAAGIELEITGAENLERARPCVFVINHQSGVDPMIVCTLLRHDFVGVAKQELRHNPVLGPAFAFVGTAFVDRSDTAAAIEALQPAVDKLRTGMSIAIAPEGTRTQSGALRPFKKGAFRIALAARVPIVPIVLCNSRDVLPRGAKLMRPARVRVVVHAPIDTAHWTRDDLPARIATIEELYRNTLRSK